MVLELVAFPREEQDKGERDELDDHRARANRRTRYKRSPRDAPRGVSGQCRV